MNLSGSGIGWTLGPRGASLGLSKRGTHLNTSFAGLSSSQMIARPKRTARLTPEPLLSPVHMTCNVAEDGHLVFFDSTGTLVDEHRMAVAKKHHRHELMMLMQSKCDEINSEIEAVAEIHLETPSCSQVPRFDRPVMDMPEPVPPTPLKLQFFDKLFRKRGERKKEEYRGKMSQFEQKMKDWLDQKKQFALAVEMRRDLIERRIYVDVEAMEEWLSEVLADIEWPRETQVAFEVIDDGRRVMLDVDLPEVDDMPCKIAAVPARGMKLSVKEISPMKRQKLYMEHIHAIVFRLVGEVFAALPAVQEVMISGYSQRYSPSTGQREDEYLLAVRVLRESWGHINFDRLDQLQLDASLATFELRRNMSKTGVFKVIEPFARV